MNRLIALICAVMLATLTISTACVAAPGDWMGASLASAPVPNGCRFAEASTGFMPSELIRLDLSGFRLSGARPLRFAVA